MPIDTKKIIADAFLELARKKSPDKITVRDIAEQCGVSRQAFYYHFRDIPDVLEWIALNMMQQVFDENEGREPRETLRTLIARTVENRDILRRLFASSHSERIEQFVTQASCSLLSAMCTRHFPRTDMPCAPSAAITFLSYGVFGVLREAVVTGQCDVTLLTEELDAMFCRMLGL